jgi:pyrimidine and pyridine-specific 5'-nucleotidase
MIDDSYMNAKGAQTFGWTAVHFVEPANKSPKTPAAAHQISDLEELREIFPEFFKP